MRKLVGLLAAAVFAAVMSATPLCPLHTDVLATGYTCTVDGLTFSNFWANPVPGPITIQFAGQVGSEVVLAFNPGNLVGPYDFWFGFQVSGYHLGIDLDLTTGSLGANILEQVCSGELAPDGGCRPPNTVLADLWASSGQYTTALYPQGVAVAYIFKDIGIAEGGVMSRFAESFVVPEPMTLALIGSGLLALGLLRRRMNKG